MRMPAVVLALAACAPAMNEATDMADAAEPAATDPIVLTWPAPPAGVYHPMGAEGELVVEDRCLYLRSPGLRWLLVFPEGTRWEEDSRSVRFGDQALRVGNRVAFTGDSLAGAEAVAPGFDPRGCDARSIFRVAPALAR